MDYFEAVKQWIPWGSRSDTTLIKKGACGNASPSTAGKSCTEPDLAEIQAERRARARAAISAQYHQKKQASPSSTAGEPGTAGADGVAAEKGALELTLDRLKQQKVEAQASRNAHRARHKQDLEAHRFPELAKTGKAAEFSSKKNEKSARTAPSPTVPRRRSIDGPDTPPMLPIAFAPNAHASIMMRSQQDIFTPQAASEPVKLRSTSYEANTDKPPDFEGNTSYSPTATKALCAHSDAVTDVRTRAEHYGRAADGAFNVDKGLAMPEAAHPGNPQDCDAPVADRACGHSVVEDELDSEALEWELV